MPVDPVVGSHENLRESITRCTMLETRSLVHYNGVCNNRIASSFTSIFVYVSVTYVHAKREALPEKSSFIRGNVFFSLYNFVTAEKDIQR